MHWICLYSWSAGLDQSESIFCFQIQVTSSFGCHFEFFVFNRFLLEVALQMCWWRILSFSGGHTLSDRLLHMKKKLICKKKMLFWLPFSFFFFNPLFLPEVNDVESWVTISNAVMSKTTHIPIQIEDNQIKNVAVTVLPFFDYYGGLDVINYNNELNHLFSRLEHQKKNA